MTAHAIEAVPRDWAINWGRVPDGAADKWQHALDALMQDPAAPVLS